MKKLILLIATSAFLLHSCAKDKEVRELIKKQEQTKDGVFTDLDMKIVNLEKVKEITGKDEVKRLQKKVNAYWYGTKHLEKNKNVKNIAYDEAIKEQETLVEIEEVNKKKVEDAHRKIKALNTLLEKYGGTADNSYDMDKKEEEHDELLGYFKSELHILKRDKALYELYKKNPHKISCIKYKCTYSIKNPKLNNAKQTITKYYYISPDKTEVIHNEIVKGE